MNGPLAEHKARGHVNFRDSKLTRLLKEASFIRTCQIKLWQCVYWQRNKLGKHFENENEALKYAEEFETMYEQIYEPLEKHILAEEDRSR